MKLKSLLILAAAVLGFGFHASAHEPGAKAGPTGGKLLTGVEPHAEFLVTKDRKVEIRFIGEDNKVVAPAAQVVTVTLGDRSKPTKLAFTKDGDKLVSDKAIPEGSDLPTVVQIKTDAKAKAVNVKFNLNLSKCPTCSNLEYACTCEHGDDDDKDHKDHKDDGKKGKK
ncbi:MAG: hypothetical protein V4726_14790 [Verrucomicrobiota bacterium]